MIQKKIPTIDTRAKTKQWRLTGKKFPLPMVYLISYSAYFLLSQAAGDYLIVTRHWKYDYLVPKGLNTDGHREKAEGRWYRSKWSGRCKGPWLRRYTTWNWMQSFFEKGGDVTVDQNSMPDGCWWRRWLQLMGADYHTGMIANGGRVVINPILEGFSEMQA